MAMATGKLSSQLLQSQPNLARAMLPWIWCNARCRPAVNFVLRRRGSRGGGDNFERGKNNTARQKNEVAYLQTLQSALPRQEF